MTYGWVEWRPACEIVLGQVVVFPNGKTYSVHQIKLLGNHRTIMGHKLGLRPLGSLFVVEHDVLVPTIRWAPD